MMSWLFFVAPGTYTVLRAAAAVRHDLCGPLLGTHSNDLAMQMMYPLDPAAIGHQPERTVAPWYRADW